MGSGSFFYMYTDPALDFGWMSACPGFQDLRHSSRGEGMAEVGMRQVLVDHPLRTMDPLAAALYYIPIWEYTSAVLGMCNGTSHEHRMKNARNTLESSRYFKRSHGADHFWGSSKSQVIAAEMKASNRSLDASSKRPVTLGERMQPLSRSLTRSIVGRYKMFPRPGPTSVGACSFEIPYLPNAVGMRIHQRRSSRHLLSAATARGSQDGHTRADARARLGNSSLLLQFAGSLDVCCTGAHMRRRSAGHRARGRSCTSSVRREPDQQRVLGSLRPNPCRASPSSRIYVGGGRKSKVTPRVSCFRLRSIRPCVAVRRPAVARPRLSDCSTKVPPRRAPVEADRAMALVEALCHKLAAWLQAKVVARCRLASPIRTRQWAMQWRTLRFASRRRATHL